VAGCCPRRPRGRQAVLPWPPLDLHACAYCGGAGIAPLPPEGERQDWAVCGCKWGKAWRYDRQTDPKRRQSKVAPLWRVWASEHGIPVRSAVMNGSQPDTGSCIAPVEEWYSAAEMAKLFPQRRVV
jgi:hypothetical protein